jgi:hypothetical protein
VKTGAGGAERRGRSDAKAAVEAKRAAAVTIDLNIFFSLLLMVGTLGFDKS